MRDKLINWARAQERRQVEISAIAYKADDTRMGVVISNLSYAGCELTSAYELRPGQELIIVVWEMGAELKATVQWCKERKAGVLFTDGSLLEAC